MIVRTIEGCFYQFGAPFQTVFRDPLREFGFLQRGLGMILGRFRADIFI